MSEVKYLSPISTDSKTPYEDIKEISKNTGVEAKFIDFNLLDFTTLYTNKENQEPVSLSRNELGIFNDLDFYLDPTLAIEQVYKVEFYDIRVLVKPKIPNISIGANQSLTKIVGTVHATKDAIYENGYEELMYNFIAKKLIRANILIGIRDDSLKNELKKISSILRIKEIIDDDYTFIVAKGFEPRKSIESKLILHYKNKLKNVDKNDKIDHASRGFVSGVVLDEMIIEYIKPQNGKSGRNVRGDFIEVQLPKDNNLKEIDITENIKKIEDDTSIKYIAKKPGFVSDNQGVYDIKEQLEINEITFKDTGSVKTELDSNVSILIKEDDIFKDAIGTGVVVEAKDVSVKGNIGSNASVIADNVKIGGQTHAKAKVKAKKADIYVHIGFVEADEVYIDRLEGGTVVAKKAIIRSVIGGNITADEVIIETLVSNCTITGLSLIDIKYLRGNNNKLIIDATKIKDRSYDIEGQVEKINDLKKDIKKIPKILEAKKIIIDTNKSSIHTIKSKVEELQKSKVVPPVTFIKKLKEYQQLVGEYNMLLKEYNTKKDNLKELKNELDFMQNEIFASKIVNRSNWLELNEIKFIIVNPSTEVVYHTRQNEISRVVMVTKIGEGDDVKFEIKKSNDLELLPKLKEKQ
ncbi:putative protein (DUF342 domain) [Campylobacter pinnipediorum subsp. caledonicus]|uniref:Flagellar Assembly Protein A N-terminal region domain-containing protein n=1 Tax=Campylobacter pinnipediorum subsp. caledonicus TaxID=1874362 RepID=A0A1S6U6S3_9BACT|nr:flagellar assembly protein A [Campylobacter pinnipediorum]AQW87454.1 putative protein (DUF342 domain) [Campylobacter pinnipediorum subsp. caledonicus]